MDGFDERSQRALAVKPEELGQDKFAQADKLYDLWLTNVECLLFLVFF